MYLFIIFLAVLGIYFIGMGRFAGQLSPSLQWRHLASFTLGLLAALVVFVPSPDLFGPEHRFTVSMGQMLFAVDLVPFLLFLGIPSMMLRPFQQWDGLMLNLAKPQVAGAIGSVILLSWFIPGLFEAASRNLTIWIFKQMLFLISGFFFWWPVASPVSTWKPTYSIQLIYLFVVRLPMTALGILFTFADRIIYTSRSFSLEICAPSSLSDQQVGGLVIWMVGGLIIFTVFVIVFLRMFETHDILKP